MEVESARAVVKVGVGEVWERAVEAGTGSRKRKWWRRWIG